MAFTRAFMPKTFPPLPSFRTYQQLRKSTIVCAGDPPRKKESSGNGGKIHAVEVKYSLNSSQSVIKDQLNEMKTEAKELDAFANKAKASN